MCQPQRCFESCLYIYVKIFERVYIYYWKKNQKNFLKGTTFMIFYILKLIHYNFTYLIHLRSVHNMFGIE